MKLPYVWLKVKPLKVAWMNDVPPKKVVECHNNYGHDTLGYGQKTETYLRQKIYIYIFFCHKFTSKKGSLPLGIDFWYVCTLYIMVLFTSGTVRTKRTKKKGGGCAGSHISRAPPHNRRRRPQVYISYSVPTKMLLVYHQHKASPEQSVSTTLSRLAWGKHARAARR